jgi:hypothetical protein
VRKSGASFSGLAFSEKEEGLKVVGISSRSQGFYVGLSIIIF